MKIFKESVFVFAQYIYIYICVVCCASVCKYIYKNKIYANQIVDIHVEQKVIIIFLVINNFPIYILSAQEM